MYPYLLSFAASLMIWAVIQQWPKGGIGYKFWCAIAILIPCCLAAFRGMTIGTDTLGYAVPLFDLAKNNNDFMSFYSASWWRIWRYSSPSEFEIGYVVLVWVCAKLSGNIQTLLFFTQLLIVVPVYLAISRSRISDALFPAMCMFLFMYFNMTLNMMRQWIAMAFVFLGIAGFYVNKGGLRKQWKTAICIFIGMLFHTSALLGLVVLVIRMYVDTDGTAVLRRVIVACTVAFGTVAFLPLISNVLTAFGLGYYVNYLGCQSIVFMPNQIIMRFPLVLFAFWAFTRRDKRDSIAAFLFCAVFIGMLFSQLTSLGEQSGRIGLYFDIFAALVPALLLSTFKTRDTVQVLILVLLIAYSLCYWGYFYGLNNSSETLPYIAFWE